MQAQLQKHIRTFSRVQMIGKEYQLLWVSSYIRRAVGTSSKGEGGGKQTKTVKKALDNFFYIFNKFMKMWGSHVVNLSA